MLNAPITATIVVMKTSFFILLCWQLQNINSDQNNNYQDLYLLSLLIIRNKVYYLFKYNIKQSNFVFNINLLCYYYRKQKIFCQQMAFVFSEPRWTQSKTQDTPGPGSHSPELLLNSNKCQDMTKKKIRKGRAHPKENNKQNFKQNVQSSSLQKKMTSYNHFQENKNRIYNNERNIKPSTSLLNIEINLLSKKYELKQGSKIIDIKSFNNGKFIQINRDVDADPKKMVQSSQKQNQKMIKQSIFIRKSDASIKSVSQQKFYIGSKDQYKKRHVKNSRANYLNSKLKSQYKLNRRIKQMGSGRSGADQSLTNQTLSRQKISNQTIQRKVKPVSAKHPFQKNQELYQIQNSKYEEKQTGIEDQQSSEFISNAVPGPGAYQIGTAIKTTKKCMMYTEKNKTRFQNQNKNSYLASQLIYNYKPLTSKSRSRAKQTRVGFGSCLKKSDQKIINNQALSNQFYNDYFNIQNRCMKAKLKDALNPGFFTSKAPRFSCQINKLQQILCKDEPIIQQNSIDIKKSFNSEKYTYPFSSKVQRQKNKTYMTSNIDFTGQNFRTIQQNIQKILSQPKYLQEDEKPTSPNEYQAQMGTQEKKRVKTDIEIKHQLIQDMHGFRQRQKKVGKKQLKGFTFSPSSQQIKFERNTPSPTQYFRQKDWIKHSFNQKFINTQQHKKVHKHKSKVKIIPKNLKSQINIIKQIKI